MRSTSANQVDQVQLVVSQCEVAVGRNDVDGVGPDGHAFARFDHQHLGVPLQQFGQGADMVWCQMLDDDQRDACVGRHVGQKALQRFEAARRTADADDRNAKVRTGGTAGGGARSIA